MGVTNDYHEHHKRNIWQEWKEFRKELGAEQSERQQLTRKELARKILRETQVENHQTEHTQENGSD